MKRLFIEYLAAGAIFLSAQTVFSQIPIDPGDPPNNTDIPSFYKSKITDIESTVDGLKKGKVKVVAISPGGLPVYAVYYGEKDDLKSQANYNSAVGASNPVFYARKDASTKPVVYFVGPVHGQEGENIAGLLNLIQVAETGKDHRGKEWPELKRFIDQCRVIIIPCANPDGRKRCPYDTFVNLPCEIMTKYGQGTKKDGTLWKHPAVKALHPVKGDVSMLGAYFNDDGVNIMHDEFFFPMAEETKAIMKIARDESPDITVSLHSCCCQIPFMIQNPHVPAFMKQRISDLAGQLNKKYTEMGLPHQKEDWTLGVTVDDMVPPPRKSFNLVSALHYVSGTMSFTFECSHGSLRESKETSQVKYNKIVDIGLVLYQEMFNYIINNRIYWE